MTDDETARLLPGANPKLVLQTVVRAMRVLESVGRSGHPLSLAEIAAAVGTDRSAAQRLAHTLEMMGYLERAPGGNGFLPGRQALDRCFSYLRSNALVERATPILIELRKEVKERVDLSLFDGPSIVYAVRMQSKRENFYATLIGGRLPTFFTSGGRAMLSLLPDAEVEEILDQSVLEKYTPRTITDRAVIRERIERARRDGYALVQEEGLMGEIALGAAISDAAGRPIAAVHIAGSLSEWGEPDFRDRFAPLAMEAAAALSR
ncbi:IclR family transcriptional regulator [Chachezhania antarctica]|uniref:IclR family transcriptional regulator n=1 Tax=Chachezhania antarctica TaxID=2340860 RepID=UPI000EB52FEE|nr:IclR family transcriptional regulator [Chachezhania antarctica]